MNKFIISLSTFVVLSFASFAAEQAPPRPIGDCLADTPFGVPVTAPNTVTNCRTGYMVNIDLEAKIPHWTAHTLEPKDAVACLPRDDAFAPDLSLPKGKRAELEDYRKSGYDQGHMVSNADLSFSEQAQKESFLLSNMSPQLPGLNRGVWKQLETATRAWSYTNNAKVSVIAGNIWTAQSKTIGPNKVVVPDQLFKVVIMNDRSYAFLFPNREALGSDLLAFQTTVANVEKITGFTFNVPDNKLVLNQIPTIDAKKVAEDKRNLCK
jgi:endonuclease G